jgi:hypothetical protein
VFDAQSIRPTSHPALNTGGPTSCGAIYIVDGGQDDMILPDVTCLGTLVVDGNLNSIQLYDVGSASADSYQITINHLTGTISNAGDFVVFINGGNGTVGFTSGSQPGHLIDTSFIGTLIADGVTVDLGGSVVNSAITLTSLSGGGFINYSIASRPHQSRLSLAWDSASEVTMAATYREVTALDTHRDDGGRLRFFVTLNGPAGNFRVPLSADALMEYSTFVREVLVTGGIVYTHPACEGREPGYGNDLWRRFTGWLLNEAAQRAATAGAMVD